MREVEFVKLLFVCFFCTESTALLAQCDLKGGSFEENIAKISFFTAGLKLLVFVVIHVTWFCSGRNRSEAVSSGRICSVRKRSSTRICGSEGVVRGHKSMSVTWP